MLSNKKKMSKLRFLFCAIFTVGFSVSALAYRSNTDKSGSSNTDKAGSAGCLPPSSSSELNVNNVRALIHSGGDMWWDLIANARYEIPKGSGRHSLYLGTLWIGGREASTTTLKVAAQRYRSSGVDYWTGPLDTLGTAEIDAETCELYDRLWSITRQEVELFRLCNCLQPDDPACEGYTVPESIKRWPGNPIIQSGSQHLNMQHILAPYKDVNEDGVYNWEDCDYPFYDLDNDVDCAKDRSAFIYGDFTLYWVFNDKGNIHGESKGVSIGMEIRAQAFGFNTNDEINNMTFYNYELTNRGTTILEQCYFGVNTDADVGGANDDYTGCDVQRGFGFMYNGDAFDEAFSGQLGYGENPPAVGLDFFEGPYLDSNGVAEYWDPRWGSPGVPVPSSALQAIADLRDTSRFSAAFGINGLGFHDSIVDNERFGMRRFVYYNNGGSGFNSDPSTFTDYYNFLRGFWKDASRMVYGGTGYPGAPGATATPADFMFPDDSDPLNWGTKGISPGFNWREQNTGAAPNLPGDRRFVQSAGPFTLKPGAVNDITLGAVWARTSSGDPFESVIKVRKADDKAQSLFENCFRVLNGPDAPDMNIQELDQEIILYLTNKSTSNNYLEEYEEFNYFIPEFEENIVTYSHEEIIEIPNIYDSLNLGGGGKLYLYSQVVNNVNPDSLVILYDMLGNEIDTLFGYFNNQSTYVVTTVVDSTVTQQTSYDRMIRFQGYLIYQVKSPTVTATDIYGNNGALDLTVARLVAQCDIRDFDENGNPIGKLVNFQFDEDLGYSIPVVKVDGANTGIVHSFRLTEDQFSTSMSKTLVNHKSYYYVALAYGYNSFKPYDPNDPLLLDGQKEPFFLGRRNIRVYTAVPHIPAPELGGSVLNALYGTGPNIKRIEGRGNGGNVLDLTKESRDAALVPPYRIEEPIYEKGRGPVTIKVIDPLSIRGGTYQLKFVNADTLSSGSLRGTTRWVLLDPGSPFGDTVAVSEKDISQPYEQIVFDRRDIPGLDPFMGFSISVSQVNGFGPNYTISGCNVTEARDLQSGFLEATMTYEDETQVYMGFLPDVNGPTPLNWVRSGTANSRDANDQPFNSANIEITLPVVCGTNNPILFMDPQQVLETNVSFYGQGGMVPYLMTSSMLNYTQGGIVLPGHGLRTPSTLKPEVMKNFVGSVDIVITPDQSKWTRVPVFETQDDTSRAFKSPLSTAPGAAGPNKFSLRQSPSVDKNGNPADVNAPNSNDENSPNYISRWGMGWFPGYAVDVETGERLNMAFGEDSYLSALGGRDMIFKPAECNPQQNFDNIVSEFGDYLLAGKHYLYVFGSNRKVSTITDFPHYDAGAYIMSIALDGNGVPKKRLNATFGANGELVKIWSHCIWSGIPFQWKGSKWLDNEAVIRLRVTKPYQYGYSALSKATAPENNNAPMYEFSFDDLRTETGNNATAASALDLIQVVPNPYYAASGYETSQVDNRVKIVNLPDRCTISIYTLSGTLIRRFEKATSQSTSVDWDLKNYKNIPIASGLYIIHVKAPDIGERILKWYGIMRPIDLDTF